MTPSASRNPFVIGGVHESGDHTTYIPSLFPTCNILIPTNAFIMVSLPPNSSSSVPLGGNVSVGEILPSFGVVFSLVAMSGGYAPLPLSSGNMSQPLVSPSNIVLNSQGVLVI